MAHEQIIQQVRDSLNDMFYALDSWFDHSLEGRAYLPQDNGWSINDLLEHVSLTSHFLLIVIRKGCEKAVKRAKTQPVPTVESDLNAISVIGHPDAFAWLRPEHMEPTRKVTEDEIRSRLRQQHTECLSLLDKFKDGQGALYKVRMSVQNLGKMDMYQWLFFLAMHGKRHLVEIERVWSDWERQ
jgi:hypothetical protein